MNRDQLDLIPDKLLIPHSTGCARLLEWLDARGWRMSLADLDAERRSRGIHGRR